MLLYMTFVDYSYGKCKVCGQLVFLSSQRLASHKRESCKNIPKVEKEYFESLLPRAQAQMPVYVTRSKSRELQKVVENEPLQVESKKGPLEQCMRIVKCNKAEETIIDGAMADFFFRTPTSFRTIDSKPWKRLVSVLNPAYAKVMKSASTLAGTQLSSKYDEYRKMLFKKIETSKGFVLASDGWTSVRTEHLVNFIVLIPGHKPLYFKSVNTSGLQMNAETQKKLIVDAATELGISKWIGVIVDNAYVMQVAMEMIEKEFPQVCFLFFFPWNSINSIFYRFLVMVALLTL